MSSAAWAPPSEQAAMFSRPPSRPGHGVAEALAFLAEQGLGLHAAVS
jgi:hypothetical protein